MNTIYTILKTGALGTMLAGAIVVATPSGQSNVAITGGVASVTVSNYSAQVNDIVAAPGEHVTATPAGVHTATSDGQTATVAAVEM